MQMENNYKKIIIKISSQLEKYTKILALLQYNGFSQGKTNKSPITVSTGHKVVVTNPDTLINHKWVPQKVHSYAMIQI